MSSLVSTKLRKPHIGTNYLERPRLTRLLKEIDNKKVTLVEASAGSGKSMLLAAYFSQQKLLDNLIWFNVSAECDDPSLFWSYVMEGFRSFLGETVNQEFEFVQSQFSKHQIRELMIFIINHVPNRPLYFVLDDVHLIQNKELWADLEYFMKELPETLHVIFLSRRPIPFYLAQWQLAGQLLQIDQKELAFTEGETLAFIKSYLPELNAEAKQLYWQFSEGWIGGLQLLLADNRGQAKYQFSDVGNKALVYEYLKREIYADLPAYVQTFLLITVQFSYFNEALCQTLFPEYSFVQWLEELEKNHIMLQIVDQEQQLYRYHHLFEELLLQEQQEVSSSQLKKSLKQGILVFQQLGDWDEAIRLALVLKSYEEAMDMILKIEQPLKMLFYMNQVPNSAIISNFDFTLQKFFFHYANFELTEVLTIYQLAMEQIDSNPKFELFRGMEYLIGEMQVVFEIPVLTSETIQQLRASDTTKALMMIRNVAVLFHQSRYREGLEQVRYNKELTKQLKSDYLTFYNLNMEAQMLEEMGWFNQSLTVYEELRALIDQSDSLNQISIFFELSYKISIIGTYLKQINLDKALENLENIEFEDSGVMATHREAYLYNKVEYLYLSGQVTEAWEGLKQLLQTDLFAELLPISNLLKYALELNQLSQQIQNRFKEKYEETHDTYISARLFYIRLLIREERLKEAEKFLEPFLLKSRKEKLPLKIVEGNLLKIRILLTSPARLKEAQNLYLEAIYYACDDQIKQPFFVEQEALKRLFKVNYEVILKALSGVELAFHQQLVTNWQLVVTNPLTERETDILREIAKGKTTKEMAATLFISEATAKTHILNIYRKFEVNSRVAAVERGQQMGILTISN